MPFDSIAVIAGKLMVEVVVSFAEGDERSNDVIPRRVAVIKGLITEPMGQRVDAESSLLDEEDSEDTGIDKSTDPVTPAKTSNKSREDQPHKDNNPQVVLMLPDNNRVFIQVGNIGAANTLRVLLHDHPPQMRVHKTLANTIGVLVGIGITMVSPVVPRPPTDRSFNSTTSNSGKEELERESSRIRRVSPETMVSSGYTETGPKVVGNRPNESFNGQWSIK